MTTPDYLLELTAAARAGGALPAGALAQLRAAGTAAEHRRAGRAFTAITTEGAGTAPVPIEVLATSTVTSLEPILRAVLVADGLLPDIGVGDYGQFDRLLREPSGPAAEATLLVLDSGYFLPTDWRADDLPALLAELADRVVRFSDAVVAAAEQRPGGLVLHTLALPARLREAVISWRGRAAVGRCWHQLNAELLALAERHPGIGVIELTGLLADSPAPATDSRLHSYADIAHTDQALLLLAREFRRYLAARSGRSRKVLVLDLDNTSWGGVLGEVGPTGIELGGLYPGNCYLDLQRAALRLREQGVILAVASKNEASLVHTTLAEHPEMLLRPAMLAACEVNWQPKPASLRRIAEQLDLGLDSFVFMDDADFERGAVEHELPEVAVIRADGEPAELVDRLLGAGWFDVLDTTATDQRRPELYRNRAVRKGFAGRFDSYREYLAALEVQLVIGPAGPYEYGRLAQLAGRTNQFNLTGRRFDEAETARLADDPDHLVVSCAVSDRFGDEGVVGAAWVRRGSDSWQVLNLLLSCRVLGRGVELAMVGWLARTAAAAGAGLLTGTFVATERNQPAAELWPSAGFTAGGARDGGLEYALSLDRLPEQLRPDWISVTEREQQQ